MSKKIQFFVTTNSDGKSKFSVDSDPKPRWLTFVSLSWRYPLDPSFDSRHTLIMRTDKINIRHTFSQLKYAKHAVIIGARTSWMKKKINYLFPWQIEFKKSLNINAILFSSVLWIRISKHLQKTCPWVTG